MSIQLERADFDRLRDLLVALPDFRSENQRMALVDEVFIGSPRRLDVIGLLDLSPPTRKAAINLINRLCQFGQDEPGQETLGLLINILTSYLGGGEDAQFLSSLFERYPLKGEPIATRGLDAAWRGSENETDVAEKVIGENTLRYIHMLELGLEAAKGVVRIRNSHMGSGFLVGERLIMTNNHVIGSPAIANQSIFEFNYQLDRSSQPLEVFSTRAVPNGLFYTSPSGVGLDMTVIEIEATPAESEPLKLVRQRVKRDDRVTIIQHPSGHYKQISMQNNFVAFADNKTLQYLTTTEPGSSGSPVMNDDFLVVGQHHSGSEKMLEPGSNRRYLRNAGSSMIAILQELEAHAPDIYARLNLA